MFLSVFPDNDYFYSEYARIKNWNYAPTNMDIHKMSRKLSDRFFAF